MRRVWIVLAGLLGLVVGFTAGSLVALWPWSSSWFEAVGTWFSGLVTATAVALAVVAYRSEEFARRREHRLQIEAAEDAREVERAELQKQADLLVCRASPEVGNEIPPDLLNVRTVVVWARNDSSYTVRDLFYRIPQLGDEPIMLSAMLLREGEASKRIEVHNQLTVHRDNRELDESATFTFTLGGVNWLAKYGQPAERQPG